MVSPKIFFSMIVEQLETAINKGNLGKAKEIVNALKCVITENYNSDMEQPVGFSRDGIEYGLIFVRPVQYQLVMTPNTKIADLLKPFSYTSNGFDLDVRKPLHGYQQSNKSICKNGKQVNNVVKYGK